MCKHKMVYTIVKQTEVNAVRTLLSSMEKNEEL